nr:hydantoinase/oxoprolinase N-terminal domain-containing protein [Paraburkholderia pallida]
MNPIAAPEAAPAKPCVGIDIGGTFTDFVLEAGGVRHTHKRLTTPDAPERAVLEVCGICSPKPASLPPTSVPSCTLRRPSPTR